MPAAHIFCATRPRRAGFVLLAQFFLDAFILPRDSIRVATAAPVLHFILDLVAQVAGLPALSPDDDLWPGACGLRPAFPGFPVCLSEGNGSDDATKSTSGRALMCNVVHKTNLVLENDVPTESPAGWWILSRRHCRFFP